MPVKLLWTPKARADVKNIYIHMCKEQPRNAERYFANFRRKAELLVEHPCLGERHPEVFRTARILVEAPYVIQQGPTLMTVLCIPSRSSEWSMDGVTFRHSLRVDGVEDRVSTP